MRKSQRQPKQQKQKTNRNSNSIRLFSFKNNKETSMPKSSAMYNDEYDVPKLVSVKRIRYDNLKKIEPMTDAQRRVFDEYADGNNLVLHGMAGVGKTFLALYLALEEVLSRETHYEKVVVVRSATPVKDLGFLPGSIEEKVDVYQQPYRAIFNELFPKVDNPLEKLVDQKLYEFVPTSFIRGITLHNTIIIMDEFSSATFHELDSVITRLGGDCKIVFCGDKSQTDLIKKDDINGIGKFMTILKHMPDFRHVEFGAEDIVRSELVKSYILAKHKLDY